MSNSRLRCFILFVFLCALPACGNSVTLVPVSSIKAEPTGWFALTWDQTPLPQQQNRDAQDATFEIKEIDAHVGDEMFTKPAQSAAAPADAEKAGRLFVEGKDLAAHGRPA